MAEVVREIVYRKVDDGDGDGGYEPVLIIKPKVRSIGQMGNFAIRLNNLWMYTPDKNPNFDRWMYHVVSHIYQRFNLGIMTTQKMAEVATVIEDGIDELLKAPPDPPKDGPEHEREKAISKFIQENLEVTIGERG